jgi:glucose-1-phosphate cytidylyltransferase
MKVAILCGGLGTRLSEETVLRPKPMVEIGGRPMVWHIMKGYAEHGFNEFVLALGYKGEMIKDYFLDYRHHVNSLTVCLRTGKTTLHDGPCEDWTVHLLNTGLHTMTGGRVLKLARFVGNETFMLTYGDGLSDLDSRDLLEFHRSHGRLVTVTAVRPPTRFGDLTLDGDSVVNFAEKPQIGEGWISGGFFVVEPGVADYIEGDGTIWEREPLERLAKDGQVAAYRHEGFWRCADTLRDVRLLEEFWNSGAARWKVWD